jgi:hypothetical protein
VEEGPAWSSRRAPLLAGEGQGGGGGGQLAGWCSRGSVAAALGITYLHCHQHAESQAGTHSAALLCSHVYSTPSLNTPANPYPLVLALHPPPFLLHNAAPS